MKGGLPLTKELYDSGKLPEDIQKILKKIPDKLGLIFGGPNNFVKIQQINDSNLDEYEKGILIEYLTRNPILPNEFNIKFVKNDTGSIVLKSINDIDINKEFTENIDKLDSFIGEFMNKIKNQLNTFLKKPESAPASVNEKPAQQRLNYSDSDESDSDESDSDEDDSDEDDSDEDDSDEDDDHTPEWSILPNVPASTYEKLNKGQYQGGTKKRKNRMKNKKFTIKNKIKR
jgi:cobalamin biosynthesis protein CobT